MHRLYRAGHWVAMSSSTSAAHRGGGNSRGVGLRRPASSRFAWTNPTANCWHLPGAEHGATGRLGPHSRLGSKPVSGTQTVCLVFRRPKAAALECASVVCSSGRVEHHHLGTVSVRQSERATGQINVRRTVFYTG